MNKTVVINVVWGEEYNRFFVEHSLSTFLAKGNLEVLQGGCYRLYTTATDAAFIKESSSWKILKQFMAVEIFPVGALGNRYATASACYRDAIQELKGENAIVVLISPDLLLANGGLKTAMRYLESGKRAVLTPVLRIQKEAVGK